MSPAGPPHGLAAARRRLAALPAAARSAAREALGRIGDDVLAEARRALSNRAGGVAVAGAPPHDPTGALAASLTATIDPDTDRLTVASTSPAAVSLEFGTRRMGARPFLRPAVAATRAAALAHCRAAAARALKETP